jgi:Low-density lipoprotein receptor domain class A
MTSERLLQKARRNWLGVLTLASAVASGCGKQSSSEADTEGAVANRLRACGLLTPGPTTYWSPPATSGYTQCSQACFVIATCENLRAVFCGGGVTGALKSCVTECQNSCTSNCQAPPFTCADGKIVGARQRCDQEPDCADGSDEQGCVVFTCQNGQIVPAESRCNGRTNDCGDGSDETGCPTFQCDHGEVLPGTKRCDFRSDCPMDASDERGCAGLICSP